MTDEEALAELADALEAAHNDGYDGGPGAKGISDAALEHVRQRIGLLKNVPLWVDEPLTTNPVDLEAMRTALTREGKS